MKKIYMFLFATLVSAGSLQAQTLDELKAQKAALETKVTEAEGLAKGFTKEIEGVQKQIDILSGWQRGLSGTIGFDFAQTKNWAAAPNKDASSTGLGIGIAAFAHNIKEKTLWRNNLTIEKAWQKVDLGVQQYDAEGNPLEAAGLFDSGTVDILNLSSLYGYRIHPKFAITGLGEINTSIEKFLKPGSADVGIGGTWTPSNNLVVVIHPFNYHYAWAADGAGDGTGSIGAKIRADYNKTYNIGGKDFNLGSTFTTFLPYGSKKLSIDPNGVPDSGDEYNASLFEYTWVNTVSFEILNGIGVGVGFGFRNSEVESLDPQSYYKFGLTYGLSY